MLGFHNNYECQEGTENEISRESCGPLCVAVTCGGEKGLHGRDTRSLSSDGCCFLLQRMDVKIWRERP